MGMMAPSKADEREARRDGGKKRRRFLLTDRQFGAAISLPGVAALLCLVVLPIVLLFVISLMEYIPPSSYAFVGLVNFSAVLTDDLFWIAVENTVVYAGGVAGVTLILGTALGVSLSNITRLRTLFRTVGLFPWAVPLVVSAIMWAWFFDPQVGILNKILIDLGVIEESINITTSPLLAMAAVIVADAWTKIPFLTIFVLAGIEGIPEDIYEAARADGASVVRTFVSITLPLIRAPLLTGLLIISMFSFRALDAVYLMTQGGPARATYTLAYYLADQLWLGADFGGGSATGVLMLVMVAAFAIVYVHFIARAPEAQ